MEDPEERENGKRREKRPCQKGGMDLQYPACGNRLPAGAGMVQERPFFAAMERCETAGIATR